MSNIASPQGKEHEGFSRTFRVLRELLRAKWVLWHGNAASALQALQDLEFEVELAGEERRESGRPPSVALRKLERALREFSTYIASNHHLIPSFAERYHTTAAY